MERELHPIGYWRRCIGVRHAGFWRGWDEDGRLPGGRRSPCISGGRCISLGYGGGKRRYRGQGTTIETVKAEVDEFLNSGYITISNRA